MKKFFIAVLILNALVMPMADLAFAAEDGGTATERFLSIADRIKGFAVGLLIALSTLFIIYAGFLYVTAGANPKGVEQAKNIITYAVIGIIVALLSEVIVGVVSYVLTGRF